MKIGVITDTHLGKTNDNNALHAVMERLTDEFHDANVDTVIHLGDIAHEEPEEKYETRVNAVKEHFTDFDYYMTMGNHDALAMNEDTFTSTFNTDLNTIIGRNKTHTALTINSAGTGQFANLGRISETGLALLEQELENGQDCTVFTHYPLQYTPYHQNRPVFDTHPEYTFPVNKHAFGQLLAEHPDTAVTMVTGHLHPFNTIKTETSPHNTPLHIIEPAQLFTKENNEIVWSVNTDLSINNLTYTV